MRFASVFPSLLLSGELLLARNAREGVCFRLKLVGVAPGQHRRLGRLNLDSLRKPMITFERTSPVRLDEFDPVVMQF